jgi:hypothetical protein
MEVSDCVIEFDNIHDAMEYAASKGLTQTFEEGNGHEITQPLTSAGEYVFTIVGDRFIPKNIIKD